MKLNNTQIKAIAKGFFYDLKEKEDELDDIHNEKYLERYKPFYKEIQDIFKKNPNITGITTNLPGSRDSMSIYKDEDFESFCDNWTIKQQIPKRKNKKKFDIPSIENQIVLATIDSTTFDELMEKLKSKFK